MERTRDSCVRHRPDEIVDVLLSISRVSNRLANNLTLLKKQRMTSGGKTHEQNERPFYVHLSRQEVLYKLPLNISIDVFWPQLLNHRKMNGTILPLHSADGRPYWYVLTPRMISASEVLCEAALAITDTIDPYRVTMTTAMTEEMFFTSFVEGAQIDVQEAMEFLERGTEPENIQEQMIHNNRAAWSDMIKILYYPIDERFVKTLAYRLTDGMDNQAEEYRTSDAYSIVAMENEEYHVPRGVQVPGLMTELYSFMANPSIHPLIKAAAAQAYILVIRPFPEGNERLSRMVSYAILLRSGYDFFRDISLSGVIARENYRYYKSMREIIREENGCDFTYFMEYYLDMLARSLAVKEERESRMAQATIEHEREAAKHPLAQVNPGTPTDLSEQTTEVVACDESPDEPEDELDGHFDQRFDPDQYLAYVKQVSYSVDNTAKKARRERVERILSELVEKQIFEFSRNEWRCYSENNYDSAAEDCKYMLANKLVLISCQGSKRQQPSYILPIVGIAEQEPEPVEMLSLQAIENRIQEYRQNGSKPERNMAIWLKDMLQAGFLSFTYADFAARHQNASKYDNTGALRAAVGRGLLKYDGKTYSFCIEDSVEYNGNVINLPEKTRNFILQLMEFFPRERFSINGVESCINMSHSAIAFHLDHMEKRGLVKCERRRGHSSIYELSEETHAIFSRKDDESTEFHQTPEQKAEVEEVNENAG